MIIYLLEVANLPSLYIFVLFIVMVINYAWQKQLQGNVLILVHSSMCSLSWLGSHCGRSLR